MNPFLSVVDFNERVSNPQKLGSVINDVCEGKFVEEAVQVCGRIAVTAGVNKANGWTQKGNWIGTVHVNNELMIEGKNVNGYTLGKNKFETWNELSKIRNIEDFDNKTFSPNFAVGGRWDIDKLETCKCDFIITAEFEKEGKVEIFGVKYSFWLKRKSYNEYDYFNEQGMIADEDDDDEKPECTEDKTVICKDGSKVVTHKCVNGKYIATGNECPEPIPEKPIEEEKMSLGKWLDETLAKLKKLWWLWFGILSAEIFMLLLILVF
jgi:hypothetical protein